MSVHGLAVPDVPIQEDVETKQKEWDKCMEHHRETGLPTSAAYLHLLLSRATKTEVLHMPRTCLDQGTAGAGTGISYKAGRVEHLSSEDLPASRFSLGPS